LKQFYNGNGGLATYAANKWPLTFDESGQTFPVKLGGKLQDVWLQIGPLHAFFPNMPPEIKNNCYNKIGVLYFTNAADAKNKTVKTADKMFIDLKDFSTREPFVEEGRKKFQIKLLPYQPLTYDRTLDDTINEDVVKLWKRYFKPHFMQGDANGTKMIQRLKEIVKQNHLG